MGDLTIRTEFSVYRSTQTARTLLDRGVTGISIPSHNVTEQQVKLIPNQSITFNNILYYFHLRAIYPLQVTLHQAVSGYNDNTITVMMERHFSATIPMTAITVTNLNHGLTADLLAVFA